MYASLILLSLVSCRSLTPTELACSAAEVLDQHPVDGADPVGRLSPIILTLSQALDPAEASLSVQADGAAVTGSLSAEGETLRWTPTEPLPARAAVSWSADLCGTAASGQFSTGTATDPAVPTDLAGTAYALDLSSATWVAPAGGQVLFGQLFGGQLLLGVQAASDTEIDLLGGAATVLDDGTVQQDPCIATFDFAPADFSGNPYVQVGPTTLSLSFQGIPVPVKEVVLTGAFTADGQGIADARLDAELDARDIADQVGTSWSQLCDMLTAYTGLSCVDCSTDGRAACIVLQVEDIDGSLVPGLSVHPNEEPQECDTGGGGA